MTKIINFFGGPAIGKSTAATHAYAFLRQQGVSCELVREFARELVWANRMEDLADQYYVFAEQHHRQLVLLDKVEYVITDSAILNSIIYRRFHKIKILANTVFDAFVLEMFNKYDNVNLFLKREITESFETEGRLQTQQEAIAIDELFKDVLNEYNIPFTEIDRNNFLPELKSIVGL